MEALIAYFLAITPAFLVATALLALLPREFKGLRILVYILFFVLARDAMTPPGFWQLSPGALRFNASPLVLLVVGSGSLSMVALTYLVERRSMDAIRWIGPRLWSSLLLGAAGVLAIALAVLALKSMVHLQAPPVPPNSMVPVILLFALAGNLYEEFLFRGLLQAHLERHLPAVKAALASGLFFCLCHTFLAVSVTQVGTPILAFTLIEGVVAGLVFLRGGVVGATLAHGGAIFLLASGLI